MIPKIIHFIHPTTVFDGTQDFNFFDYLIIKNCFLINKEFEIKLWLNYENKNKYLEKLAKETNVKLVKIKEENKMFLHPQHFSDFLRIKIIEEEGGIYLDTDMLIIKNLNPLTKLEKTNFPKENKTRIGISCILAKPHSEIFKDWEKSYENFVGNNFIGQEKLKKLSNKEEKGKQINYYLKNSIYYLEELIKHGKYEIEHLESEYFYKPGKFYIEFNNILKNEYEPTEKQFGHHLWRSCNPFLIKINETNLYEKNNYLYNIFKKTYETV